jgi:hypothetical protein
MRGKLAERRHAIITRVFNWQQHWQLISRAGFLLPRGPIPAGAS